MIHFVCGKPKQTSVTAATLIPPLANLDPTTSYPAPCKPTPLNPLLNLLMSKTASISADKAQIVNHQQG